MTKIVLTATEKNSDYLYGRGIVKITHDHYPLCKLFQSYKHTFIKTQTGNIEIRKDTNRGNGLIIRLNESYKDKPVQYVKVYFNKHDSKNEHPLVLVLFFGDDSDEIENKYYRLSTILDELGSSQEIYNLKGYENDEDILKPLVEENDKTKILLTYQLDKKDTEKYNGDKIKLTMEKVKGKNSDTSDGFTKYKHEPELQYNNKPWCYLLCMNLLMGRANKLPIPIVELENQKYIVAAYWSPKVDIPLLLEFNQSKENNVQYFEYYIIKNDKNGIYLEKLENKTKELRELSKDSDENIHIILTKDDNKLLIELLKKLETNLFKILLIMVDKQNEYSRKDIDTLFNDSFKYRLINKEAKISVENLTNESDKCLSYSGFKVFEQYFTNTVESTKQNNKVKLKFIIPNRYDKNYSELSLYNNIMGNEKEDILYYNPNHNKLYVYFISEDPRPLLMCYGNSTYGPKSEHYYFTKWYRYENVTNTVCTNGLENNELLKVLCKIVGFLNTVQLDKKPITSNQNKEPKSAGKSDTYIIQWFNSEKIEVNLSSKNETCYRIYTHTPNGTGNNRNGFRLGNIVYGSQKTEDNELKYVLSKILTEVSVLYNVHDYHHRYPLLVILKFGIQEIEYYKLTNKDKPYKWVKMENNNSHDIEEWAQSIKNELQVEFTDEEKKRYLFDPKDCKEHSSSGAVAGTLTTLGLAAFGTGLAYYKYPEVFERLYRRVIYLIQIRLKW